MVYVTDKEQNIETFLTWQETEKYCEENNLDIETSVSEMDL